jgi:hypothetical protein
MAPIIEVSDETLKTLNPEVYTRRDGLEVSHIYTRDNNYIEVPELNLAIAKQRTYQGKNWHEAHEALGKEGSRMLTLPEFVGFLNYLRLDQDNQGFQDVFSEIVGVRSPWRAEWIDAFFEQDETGFYILTQNKSQKQRLNGGLRENRFPGISLEAWLKNPTKQGLPRANVAEGDLYYGSPANGSVARFFVDSVRADLYADRNSSNRGVGLGVRAAKQLK